MNKINDIRFVFYWRSTTDWIDGKSVPKKAPAVWQVSQPVTLGEIIEGGVELELSADEDGETGSLPLSDVEWGSDEIRVVQI